MPKVVSRKIEATSHEFSLTVDAIHEKKPHAHKFTVGYGRITDGFYKFGKEETKITSGNTVFGEIDFVIKSSSKSFFFGF